MRAILSLLLLVCSCLCAQAQTFCAAPVTLAWDRNLESDIAGYRLYVRAGSPTNCVAVPMLALFTTNCVATYVFTNIATYSAHVTAVNTSGLESLPSNVVLINIGVPKPPTLLVLESITLVYTNRPPIVITNRP